MSVHRLKDGRWFTQYRNQNGSMERKYFGRGLEAEKFAFLDDKSNHILNSEEKNSKSEKQAVERLINKLKEYYQESELELEFKFESGVIDILTPDEIIEVKNVGGWKGGIGQLLVYAEYFPGKNLRLHLFGGTTGTTIKKIIPVCQKNKIEITHEHSKNKIPNIIRQRIRRRFLNNI